MFDFGCWMTQLISNIEYLKFAASAALTALSSRCLAPRILHPAPSSAIDTLRQSAVKARRSFLPFRLPILTRLSQRAGALSMQCAATEPREK